MNLSTSRRPLYLRLSVTERCNLRCMYCRTKNGPEFADRSNPISDEDILSLVTLVKSSLPVYKLRVTGGDPLLRPDLPYLIEKMRLLLPDTELAATTNGLLLSRQAMDLRKAGLDSINISLDTIESSDFRDVSGGGVLSDVQEGIFKAKEAGFKKIKLNAVLLRSFNGDSLPELAMYANALGCELRLIELMPIGVARNHFEKEYFSGHESLKKLSERLGDPFYLGLTGTAKRYMFIYEGQKIVIGLINTISEPFCESCDRLRVDSRGWLYPCLHEYEGIDLLTMMRKGEIDLAKQKILTAHMDKKSPVQEWTSRQMVRIGG